MSPAVVRHPLVDAPVLKELLAEDEYAFPKVVQDRLEPLGRPLRVLDLGGNIGLFGLRVFERFPDARVTTFEPDPRNLASLRQCAAANPGVDWTIVPAAAGVQDGEASFVSDFALGQLTTVASEFGGHEGHAQWIPAFQAYPEKSTVTVAVKDR